MSDTSVPPPRAGPSSAGERSPGLSVRTVARETVGRGRAVHREGRLARPVCAAPVAIDAATPSDADDSRRTSRRSSNDSRRTSRRSSNASSRRLDFAICSAMSSTLVTSVRVSPYPRDGQVSVPGFARPLDVVNGRLELVHVEGGQWLRHYPRLPGFRSDTKRGRWRLART